MDFERFSKEKCDKCSKKLMGKCDGKVVQKIDRTFACVEDDDE